MTAAAVDASALASLEALVANALAAGTTDGLNLIGFGEISVALGWPVAAPSHVCKRMPPMTTAQFAQYKALVNDYVANLRAAGITVVDTTVMSLPRGDRHVVYLVQAMLQADSLGQNVLAAADPDPDHPFLIAVGESLAVVSDRLSIDAQVTNFSWDGTGLTLLDVGTPFMWDDDGGLLFDMEPYTPMISAPFRWAVKRDLAKVTNRWQQPRSVATDVVGNLMREGLTSWVEPTIIALNQALEGLEPISLDEAKALYEQDRKTFPRLTRLQRIERRWSTSVRRRPYDFFIHSTYSE